jgi:hypothetical protein
MAPSFCRAAYRSDILYQSKAQPRPVEPAKSTVRGK